MEYSLLRKRARELKGSRRMNGKRHEDISIVERRDLIKGYIWGKRMHDNLIPVALFAVVPITLATSAAIRVADSYVHNFGMSAGIGMSPLGVYLILYTAMFKTGFKLQDKFYRARDTVKANSYVMKEGKVPDWYSEKELKHMGLDRYFL